MSARQRQCGVVEEAGAARCTRLLEALRADRDVLGEEPAQRDPRRMGRIGVAAAISAVAASAMSASAAPPCASANRRRYGVAPASASVRRVARQRLEAMSSSRGRGSRPPRAGAARSGRRPDVVSLMTRVTVARIAAICARTGVAAGERQLAHDEVDRLDAVGALVDRRDARIAQMLRGAGLLDDSPCRRAPARRATRPRRRYRSRTPSRPASAATRARAPSGAPFSSPSRCARSMPSAVR